MFESKSIFSSFIDICCDICLIVASDEDMRLTLSTSTIAKQVDKRSLERLIELDSKLKIVEI